MNIGQHARGQFPATAGAQDGCKNSIFEEKNFMRFGAGITFLLLAAAPLCAAPEGAGASLKPGTDVVAEIGGAKITRSEFEQKNALKLFQARNSYYEAERKALEEFVDQQLLEQQARRENVSVQALLEKHVNGRLAKDPPEEALRVYYEGLDTAEPFEAVRDKILEHVRQRRLTKARNAYLAELKSEANITLRLSTPRAQVPLDNAPLRGSANAPVVFVEYADYECPYCQQIQPSVSRIEADYKDKVAFIYKHVPLPNHPFAQKASEAAMCADKQGKYWDYHDVLVKTKEFQVPQLKQHARTLKLDAAAFDNCIDGGEQAGVVKAHMTEAQSLGLQGTPSFFINGRFFSGAMTYEKLREIVEEELAQRQVQKTAHR